MRKALAFWLIWMVSTPSWAADGLRVEIGVYREEFTTDWPLSRLDLPTEDLGFAGVALGVEDNATTGAFLGIDYEVSESAASLDDLSAKISQDYAAGLRLFIVNADGAFLTQIADAHPEALFFNTASEDVDLRNENCRANLLHIAPSYAMRADALVQYLLWKRWPRVFLVTGSHEDDIALGEAYKNSLTKFGATLVEERVFTDTEGARRTDTGYVQVQKQIPVFTQDVDDYDVAIAADVNEVFAAYLPYRTWDARPVAGSAGLRPLSWEPSMEAWGATQFQRRFEEAAGRYMRELDYQNWLAIRVIGEAVVRTGSNDAQTLRDYLLSDEFEIAAFKGVPLNFRAWNGQLRQPIILSDRHLTVSVSPQDGYLHQFNVLDTLGYDQGESQCQAF